MWAILIGLIIGNTIDLPKIFQAGIGSYEFFLKAGIVLLGARFLLGDVAKLGGISLVLVAVELVLSIAFMSVLGRMFRLESQADELAGDRIVDLRCVGHHRCAGRDRGRR